MKTKVKYELLRRKNEKSFVFFHFDRKYEMTGSGSLPVDIRLKWSSLSQTISDYKKVIFNDEEIVVVSLQSPVNDPYISSFLS